MTTMLNREVKLVRVNEGRLDEFEMPMLYTDELIAENLNTIFEVVNYDSETKEIAIEINGEEIWLYRNEYYFVIRNLFE